MKHNEIAGESGGSVPTLSAGKTSIFSLSRVALKERNRVESEGDSPVKWDREMGISGYMLKASLVAQC